MSWNAMRPARKDDRNKVKRALKAARKVKHKKEAHSLWDLESAQDPSISVVKKLDNSVPSPKKKKRNKGAGQAAWLTALRKMRCHYCGQDGGTVDHVVPKSKGGTTTQDNCVPACAPCNTFRSSRPYAWFKKTGWLERLEREAERAEEGE